MSRKNNYLKETLAEYLELNTNPLQLEGVLEQLEEATEEAKERCYDIMLQALELDGQIFNILEDGLNTIDEDSLFNALARR